MDLSLILEVSGLIVGPVTPGSPAILDRISFRLNTSDIFGIYGESGAGKTILSRALANWLPESLEYRGGQVAFAGHDILKPGIQEVRTGRVIAYIGSEAPSSPCPTVPVRSQIAE